MVFSSALTTSVYMYFGSKDPWLILILLRSRGTNHSAQPCRPFAVLTLCISSVGTYLHAVRVHSGRAEPGLVPLLVKIHGTFLHLSYQRREQVRA